MYSTPPQAEMINNYSIEKMSLSILSAEQHTIGSNEAQFTILPFSTTEYILVSLREFTIFKFTKFTIILDFFFFILRTQNK
jgi:hypothetical protein